VTIVPFLITVSNCNRPPRSAAGPALDERQSSAFESQNDNLNPFETAG
jgi:hypothetical protein